MGNWNILLADKVVFLTGAAGSVAQYIAYACFAHGARLVLGDLNIDRLNKLKDEILKKENTQEERIFVVKLDVTNETSIQQAVQDTVDKWKTIHVLINTAATYVLGNVEQISTADWSHVFDVNVCGYALMVKYIVPIFKKQNSGSILNMASVSGLVGSSNWTPYSATKGAIIQLTRNLALDLGLYNIRVNSISPSGINVSTTYAIGESIGMNSKQLDEFIKGKCLQRVCQPEEVANLFVFLASDLCPFMTGANFVIDGGSTSV